MTYRTLFWMIVALLASGLFYSINRSGTGLLYDIISVSNAIIPLFRDVCSFASLMTESGSTGGSTSQITGPGSYS